MRLVTLQVVAKISALLAEHFPDDVQRQRVESELQKIAKPGSPMAQGSAGSGARGRAAAVPVPTEVRPPSGLSFMEEMRWIRAQKNKDLGARPAPTSSALGIPAPAASATFNHSAPPQGGNGAAVADKGADNVVGLHLHHPNLPELHELSEHELRELRVSVKEQLASQLGVDASQVRPGAERRALRTGVRLTDHLSGSSADPR